jgi:hypothetical protein
MNFLVNAAASKVAGGKLTVYSLIPFQSMFDLGDVVQLLQADGSATGSAGCAGTAGTALTGKYAIKSFPDSYTAVIDISASGLSDGTYQCSQMNPAILSVAVSNGTATLKLGTKHWMETGRGFVLYNTPDPVLNGKVLTVTNIVDDRTVQFTTAAANGSYNGSQMYYRDLKNGSALPDTNTSYPTIRPPNAASDGAHVHELDFSNPVRVSSGQPHTGWSWDLNGDPVLLQQIAQSNWSAAQVDTFGFTNIYTGVYTPLFFHSDFNYDSSSVHMSRFYDRSIRGWGAFMFTSPASAKSRIRNQVLLVELKHYSLHPEIWRVGYMHNDYGCSTTPSAELFKINGCNPSKPYETEAQTNLSRDGLSYYWGGLWPNGPVAVNVYRANIPLRVKTKGSFAPTAIASTSAVVSYIAPTADSTCTATTSTNGDYSSPVERAVRAGGATQQRTFTIGTTAALAPNTKYYTRIACTWKPTDPNAVSSEEILGSFTTSGNGGSQKPPPAK